MFGLRKKQASKEVEEKPKTGLEQYCEEQAKRVQRVDVREELLKRLGASWYYDDEEWGYDGPSRTDKERCIAFRDYLEQQSPGYDEEEYYRMSFTHGKPEAYYDYFQFLGELKFEQLRGDWERISSTLLDVVYYDPVFRPGVYNMVLKIINEMEEKEKEA